VDAQRTRSRACASRRSASAREMKTDEESVDKAVEELTDYYNTRGPAH
jgi:hypothetical protein